MICVVTRADETKSLEVVGDVSPWEVVCRLSDDVTVLAADLFLDGRLVGGVLDDGSGRPRPWIQL